MHHSITETAVNTLPGAFPGTSGESPSGSARSVATSQTGSLGITAKSSTPPDREIGMREARAEKYSALSRARLWIGRRVNMMFPDVQFPGDKFRTFDCRYVRRSHFVSVHLNREFKQASYRGIATCGSVWACPVCAGKIQERRRLELEHLVNWAQLEGLQALMVTLTFPHTSFDTLADLLERQALAFKLFRSGSPYVRLKKSIGFRGLVRSLEVTHGASGWHPHTHELWLVSPTAGPGLRQRLLELWERACIAAGLLDPADQAKLYGFRQHSVDVKFNASSGDYLAKQDSSRNWGITHEVAKASSKAGKAKGVHPHEFLVRAAKGDEARYFEYLDAMKGRRQLFWSPGLKAACGIDDLDDQTVAELVDDKADLLGNLVETEWEFIRSKRAVARVLDAAEIGGWPLVMRYMKRLGYRERPPNEFPSP